MSCDGGEGYQVIVRFTVGAWLRARAGACGRKGDGGWPTSASERARGAWLGRSTPRRTGLLDGARRAHRFCRGARPAREGMRARRSDLLAASVHSRKSIRKGPGPGRHAHAGDGSCGCAGGVCVEGSKSSTRSIQTGGAPSNAIPCQHHAHPPNRRPAPQRPTLTLMLRPTSIARDGIRRAIRGEPRYPPLPLTPPKTHTHAHHTDTDTGTQTHRHRQRDTHTHTHTHREREREGERERERGREREGHHPNDIPKSNLRYYLSAATGESYWAVSVVHFLIHSHSALPRPLSP